MFITSGPLDPGTDIFAGRERELKYIEREWLRETRHYGAILGPRQIGKTSLLFKLRQSLQLGYDFVYIDLQSLSGANLTECYSYIGAEIHSQLNISGDPSRVESGPTLLHLLERVAKSQEKRIVIMLDEIGILANSPRGVAGTVRSVFTQRRIKEAFKRIIFILSGASDFLELATSKTSPLWNVADLIYLGDLSHGETGELLREGLVREQLKIGDAMVDYVYEYTHGHPYLVQRLGASLEEQLKLTGDSEVAEELIDKAVEVMLDKGDKNLAHILGKLGEREESTIEKLKEIFASRQKVRFTRIAPELAQLGVIGVIREDHQGNCVIRNEIYKALLEQYLRPLPKALIAEGLKLVKDGEAWSVDRAAILEIYNLKMGCPLLHTECVEAVRISREYSPSNIFIAIPYSEYRHNEDAIRKIIEAANLNPVIVKDKIESSMLLCKICRSIRTCKYGVADISYSNLNVIYELGIISALNKKCAILFNESVDIPVDLKGLEYVKYTDIYELAIELGKWLRDNVEEVDQSALTAKIQEMMLRRGGEEPIYVL